MTTLRVSSFAQTLDRITTSPITVIVFVREMREMSPSVLEESHPSPHNGAALPSSRTLPRGSGLSDLASTVTAHPHWAVLTSIGNNRPGKGDRHRDHLCLHGRLQSGSVKGSLFLSQSGSVKGSLSTPEASVRFCERFSVYTGGFSPAL